MGSLDIVKVRGAQHALALARSAGLRGQRPFGAALYGPDGAVALAEDDTLSSGDPTAHAELLAIRSAALALRSSERPPASMQGFTLFSSVEPCPMCAGAILYAGVGRLVFGVSRAAFDDLVARARSRPRKQYRSCRGILEDGGLTRVEGPVLEAEGLACLSTHSFEPRRALHLRDATGKG